MSDNNVIYRFSHIPAFALTPGMRIALPPYERDSAMVLNVCTNRDTITVQFEEQNIPELILPEDAVLRLVGNVYQVPLNPTKVPDIVNLAETAEFFNGQGGVTRHIDSTGALIRYTPAGHDMATSMGVIIERTINTINTHRLPFRIKIRDIEYEDSDEADELPEWLPHQAAPSHSVKLTSLCYCDASDPEKADQSNPLELFNTIKRTTVRVRADLGRTTVEEEINLLKTDADRWYATVSMTTKDDHYPRSGVTAAIMLGKRMRAIAEALEQRADSLSTDPMR